ncbi:sodium:solute symporter family transporter [Cardinium endosymbiont of Oedothorax gibbosus]|uniref:sodium:solute symporter family transporter n=1 Tax=Cardinium endosymbiont of Oedothorax gibbosus TaxID=931101 RepID=UPI002024D1F8|nr:hypothetical protein [Cardinium endosymbiont of Oedothorax gibbosus]
MGLFVFVDGGAALPIESIWNHIMTNISPVFRGVVCSSLLAMAMSTADSCLNACSVIVSYDILASLQKENKIPDAHQLNIARWATLVVGLYSMFLAFYCKDLLELLLLGFAFSLPIITAPALLAIFGSRYFPYSFNWHGYRYTIHISLEPMGATGNRDRWVFYLYVSQWFGYDDCPLSTETAENCRLGESGLPV